MVKRLILPDMCVFILFYMCDIYETEFTLQKVAYLTRREERITSTA